MKAGNRQYIEAESFCEWQVYPQQVYKQIVIVIGQYS